MKYDIGDKVEFKIYSCIGEGTILGYGSVYDYKVRPTKIIKDSKDKYIDDTMNQPEHQNYILLHKYEVTLLESTNKHKELIKNLKSVKRLLLKT